MPLVYVQTLNDAEVTDATVEALCHQTYRIPRVLLIDDARPTAGTTESSGKVTLIRKDQNLATSSRVLRYKTA
jgi:hypothetical protein